MINSTVAILITVSSVLAGLYYVKKLEFVQYQSNSVKLYLAHAGVGIGLVVLGAALLFFLLSFST